MFTDDYLHRLGAAGARRVQIARGERHAKPVSDDETRSAHQGRLHTGQLHRRWRNTYREILGTDNPDVHDEPSDNVSAAQRARLAEVDSIASAIGKSGMSDVGAHTVYAWHPFPWVSSGPIRPDTVIANLLGADISPAKQSETELRISKIPDEPTAALSAVTRHALAERDPEDVLQAWTHALHVTASITEAAKRIACPWAELPRYPRPGDAVALKHWYSLASLGSWSRLYDEPDEVPQADISVYGESAVALAAATPFWVPPGQTVGYIDSEPLTETDLADLRLPYPQVLLTLADPLELPPIRAVGVNSDLEHALNQFDAAMLSITRARKPTATFTPLVENVADTEVWDKVPDLSDVIEVRGANVEAVLLLADSLGRPADLFAWCLAIPARHGGILGRVTVPGSLSRTRLADQVLNLAAVAAWADWHPPDRELTVPPGISTRDLVDLLASPAFARLEERGGAGAVRVLNVKSTAGQAAGAEPTGRIVTPHVRRGHWRRQHYGPSRGMVKRIRIAPVVGECWSRQLRPSSVSNTNRKSNERIPRAQSD